MRDASSPGVSPIRTCVACRAKRGADLLIRLALIKEGRRPVVVLDRRRRLFGRGAWVCADNPECLAKAAAKGRLARALRVVDPVIRFF